MIDEWTYNQQPLIEAQNISKHFPIHRGLIERLITQSPMEKVKAVQNVDLKIWNGEIVGLVGESGSGKTTLGRVMTRLYEPTSGNILFQSQPVNGDCVNLIYDRDGTPHPPTPVPYFRLVQVIFQNPYSSLNPRKTIRDILGMALSNRGLHHYNEREEETIKLLERVGLSAHHINSYPHQFSGGQRQRIGIARAIAMRPRFIVADEPVSSLDVSIQAQVINLLQELQSEYSLTYLFIAHDLSVVYYISDRVAVMYLGRIVEIGPTPDVFQNPCHPYTKALLAAIPHFKRSNRTERIVLSGDIPSPMNPPSGCHFHPRCHLKKGKICETEQPPFFEVGKQVVACWLFNQ